MIIYSIQIRAIQVNFYLAFVPDPAKAVPTTSREIRLMSKM